MNMNVQYPRKKIAIIGSGISGAAAAWSLNFTSDVVLYERDARAGGHTCTVDIEYDGKPLSVDVGFIVFNERNYPNLCALFDHLSIKTERTNMSFAMSLNGGEREWGANTYASVFAQKRNLLSPSFWWMLREVVRFNGSAIKDRDSGYMAQMTIGQYLQARKFSQRFRDDYLIPMAAAIWSTPKVKMLEFPAVSFIQFFENHRLLELAPPVWQTVSGGSKNYHQKLMAALAGKVRLSTAVEKIARSGDGSVFVTDNFGQTEQFDAVIMACHSDQALQILSAGDGDVTELSFLRAVKYKPNRVILHRDPSFMPKRKNAWAAWNYMRETEANGDESEICLTYWMNRLQNIDDKMPIFVTLNPTREPHPSSIFGEWSFDHPQYDMGAFEAQRSIQSVQGKNGLYFAGAWTGFGFHEDGLKSGLAAAQALGGYIPWRIETHANLPIEPAAL